MINKQLSAYTPSNMDAETLEAIFVQRHKLLEQSVSWIEESLLTNEKNHLLFIGPRGSGKTHLITMIINRLKNSKKLNELVVIWLGEDDVVMNLTGLALAILNKMVSAYPDRFNDHCLQEAAGKKPDEVADIILQDIKVQAGDTTLLVVKENMSDVFAGLKDLGQKRLRAYLQENNHISLLCTSQKLFSGISSRDSAFWGFFAVHHLNPLGVQEALELIGNIAKLKQDQELVDFLNTSQGNYRIRALHYLAGGNHRLYIELASFLTKSSLDDFVEAVIQLADHLTPYFQERIRSLSPQQAGIVQKLCELNGAIQVKVIAEKLFLDERAVASQLKALKAMGYVIAHKRGRAAYYEIAEPLLRLSLEVKNNHGKPLKIIASLFRAWFSDKELQANIGKGDDLLKAYCKTALENNEILNNLQSNIRKDLNNSFQRKKYSQTIQIANQLLCVPNDGENEIIALTKRAAAFFALKKYKKALEDINVTLKLIKDDKLKENKVVLGLLFMQCRIYAEIGNLEKELQALNEFIEIPQNHQPFLLIAIFSRSLILYQIGDFQLCLEDLNFIIENKTATKIFIFNKALFNRAQIYVMQEEYKKALNDLYRINNIENLSSKEASLILLTIAEVHYLTLTISKARKILSAALQNSKQDLPNSDTLLFAIAKLGSNYWQQEIGFLLLLYAEYQCLPHLASGLIRTIRFFVHDKTLHSAFNKWAELWHDAGNQYPEMQPAIDALNASAKALSAGNDKPLLALPKEIRALILPMFEFK